jgi:ABC-type uncharacterized transport system permease subunit
MNQLLIVVSAAAYVLSMASYLRFLYTGKPLAGRLGTMLLVCALVGHYFVLLERSQGLTRIPYHDLYGAMSLFGWLLALTYLGLEVFHRQRSVGAFLIPLILIFFLAASIAPQDRFPGPRVQGVAFAFHVTLSILAYAAFALSCVLSLIFLMEERLLRIRSLGGVVWRLPPLELLERMSRSSVLVGLVSIVIGMSLGFLQVDRLMGRVLYYDPKYAVTLIVLVLYIVYFRLARTTAWRGARASKLCVFNFLMVIFSFTVVNLFLSHTHRFY